MARLFILIRRKGSKRFLGAIPTRKGATMASLRKIRIKGFVFKIITEKQLKRIILKQRPRTIRRIKGRRTRRKVTRRKVKGKGGRLRRVRAKARARARARRLRRLKARRKKRR